MSLLITGLSIAKGVAVGKAYVMKQGQIAVPEYNINLELIDSEVERYTQAIKTTRDDLQTVSDNIGAEVSVDIADFIASHILTLDEAAINLSPRTIIRKQKINAEWALKQQFDELVKVFDDIDDPYLQSRQNDILQVANMILKNLSQQGIKPLDDDNELTTRIIITQHLNPSDLITLSAKNIAGFVSEHDAPTSHTAIMARNLGVPVITGIHNIHQYVNDGENVLIDGKYGTICINPDIRSTERYQKLAQEIATYKQNLQALTNKPTITLDKQKITLYTNLDSSYDLRNLNNIAPVAVGLYRTETLYLNRDSLPDETEQLILYQQLAELDIPVNIRTLDIGADENLPGVKQETKFNNPMLGLRAIRFSLSVPDIFIVQLRAIIRASAFGEVNILLPMIVSLDELQLTKQYIATIKQDLTNEDIAFDDNIKIGVVIETPAMALSVGLFAKHVDYFAIGTNDLVQYMLAIDRADEQVSHLYDPCHHAILNIISQIINTANDNDTPVYMCGEIAGNIRYTRLLLGMGLRVFSVMPTQVLEVKRIIRSSNVADAKLYTDEILKSSKPKRIKELVYKLNHA